MRYRKARTKNDKIKRMTQYSTYQNARKKRKRTSRRTKINLCQLHNNGIGPLVYPFFSHIFNSLFSGLP